TSCTGSSWHASALLILRFLPPPPPSPLFPYTTLFRSLHLPVEGVAARPDRRRGVRGPVVERASDLDVPVRPGHYWVGARRGRVRDRKSTRLNSSHVAISYAVFCLKKKRGGHTARPARR